MAMPRNRAFLSRPPPFATHHGLRLNPESVSGSLPFFNPTHARYNVKSSEAPSTTPGEEPSTTDSASKQETYIPDTEVQWRSRDNRKGRHVLAVADKRKLADHTSTTKALLNGLYRMATEYPYWDVSYLVAVFFTVGCLIFIASGLFYWLPLVAPSTEFKDETRIAGGVTAFIGATLFQIGAVFLVFEACNEHKSGCFGWALHQAFHHDESHAGGDDASTCQAKPHPESCQHPHRRGQTKRTLKDSSSERSWTWWPSWHELTTHYIHETGWVASTSLALGATIFYISGICALPGIFENMSLGVARGVYWLAYLVGGVIFVFSSVLYVLETQPNWYTPAPHVLGWHIGVWNLIGSVGWTLSASFGYCTASWCEYQGELSLLWASVAFAIGSGLLWFEALDKYPVEKMRK